MTSPTRRNLLIALTIGVAATRLIAVSRSMWDWDEALFAAALRHYNVAWHNPHPPGFPLFIALAKLIRLIVPDDFRSLQTLNVIASCAAFPAMVWLAESLRFTRRTSIVAGLIFLFLPNVVFWGGTAMSDVSAVTLFILGAALLFRGRTPATLLGGSAVFAASMLIRPQNVFAMYPWLLACWRQIRERGRSGVALALSSGLLITAIVAGGYSLAALKTGWQDYINVTRAHQEYVATVDGYKDPNRPPSTSMIGLYFFDPFHSNLMKPVLALALIALLRPRRENAHILATFLPQMFFSLVMLNPMWVSRFAIAYLPAHALLAASGAELIGRFTASVLRNERFAAAAEWLFATAFVAAASYWVWPVVREVRSHASPPIAAVRWISAHVPQKDSILYVGGGMGPFTDYYLGPYQKEAVGDDFDSSVVPLRANAYFVVDRDSFDARAVRIRRPRLPHLIALYNRYYDVTIAPIAARSRFADGWYGEESDGLTTWRWMGKRGRIVLEPTGKKTRVSFSMYAPLDAVPAPNVTILVDGTVIDRFVATTSYFDRHYDLPARTGKAFDFVIEVDPTIEPSRLGRGDQRELGLQLRSLSWQPLE